MRSFIKKHLFLLLIAALASFLTFLWFVLRGQPKEEPVPLPPVEITPPSSEFLLPSQGEISVSISPNLSQFFPKSLPVFKIKKFSEDEAENYASAMVLGLGFKTQPGVVSRPDGTFLEWSQEENYLSVNKKSGRFIFSGNVKVASSVSGINAAQIANGFLSSWNIFDGETESAVLGYVSAGLELEPARNLGVADTFIVRFIPKLSGFKVFGSGSTEPVIGVKITREGNLASLTFNLSQTSNPQFFPTRNFGGALEDVSRGNAKILRVEDSGGNPFFPTGTDALASASITGVEIVFLETTEEQEFLFPFFLFSGQGKTKSGASVKVFFVSPAL